MKRALLTLLLGLPGICFADAKSDAAVLSSSSISSLNFGVTPQRSRNLNGWDHLALLLTKGGVPEAEVISVLSDPRMPDKELLHFSLEPKESSYNYRKHNTRANRVNALKFYILHKETFERAKKLYGVPESIILSILQVETFCGKNTGRSSIFPALARLANAKEPENLVANLKRLGEKNEKKVMKRAQYLESTFLPHAIGAFDVARLLGKNVHELRGSYAGAMGIPQFLPGNIIKYGVDGDGDSRVDLFVPEDAILSTANYLKQKGWSKPALSVREQRAVIWEYNRSKPYIDTVLAMSGELSRVIQRGVKEEDLVITNGRDKRKVKRTAQNVSQRARRSS